LIKQIDISAEICPAGVLLNYHKLLNFNTTY